VCADLLKILLRLRNAVIVDAVAALTLYRMVMPIGTPFLKEKINN